MLTHTFYPNSCNPRDLRIAVKVADRLSLRGILPLLSTEPA